MVNMIIKCIIMTKINNVNRSFIRGLISTVLYNCSTLTYITPQVSKAIVTRYSVFIPLHKLEF